MNNLQYRSDTFGAFAQIAGGKRVKSQTQPSVGRRAGGLRRKPLAEIQCFKCWEMGHYANRFPMGSAHIQRSSKDQGDRSGDHHASRGSIFIEGTVRNVEIDLLLDTGCTHTLMAYYVWRRMVLHPDLHASSVNLWLFNGDQLKVHGVVPWGLQALTRRV